MFDYIMFYAQVFYKNYAHLCVRLIAQQVILNVNVLAKQQRKTKLELRLSNQHMFVFFCSLQKKTITHCACFQMKGFWNTELTSPSSLSGWSICECDSMAFFMIATAVSMESLSPLILRPINWSSLLSSEVPKFTSESVSRACIEFHLSEAWNHTLI